MDPAQVAAYAAHFHTQHPQPLPVPVQQQQSFPAVNAVPSHPPYTEMIKEAIEWENKQGKVSGSSKRAIDKYIHRVFTDLPPTHSALLTHHLQRLKNTGHLVMIKNSYQLPSFVTVTVPVTVPGSSDAPHLQQLVHSPTQPSEVGDCAETPKKRRGRPPKQVQVEAQAQPLAQFQPLAQPQVQEVVVNGGSSTGKRPRGRPPKTQGHAQEVVVPFVQPVSEVVSNGVVNGNGNENGNSNGVGVVSSSGKRRGRPPKKQVDTQQQLQPQTQPQQQQQTGFAVDLGTLEERNEVSLSGKRRGRPPKKQKEIVEQPVGFQVELDEVNVNMSVYEETPGSVVERREIREVGVGRGGPKMNVGSNVVAGSVEGEKKKKRGWPKGKLRGKKGFVGRTFAKYAGKKRGRKPKLALGVVQKIEKKAYSGKPRGRKKKTATFGQGQETANEEPQRKLEDMQSKLKDAVRLIKPHLAYLSAPDALAALQQLENLSTMNIKPVPAPALTAPPVIDVTMDVTAPLQTTSAPDLTAPNLTAPSLTAPTMTAFTSSQGNNVPLPYSMNVQSMTVTPSFQAPNIENQQPLSWIPSNGGQL